MSPKFDSTNWRILAKLLEDSRQPYRQIAEGLSISESTVRKRVHKMAEEGIIKRFTIELNPKFTGSAIISFVQVTTSSQGDLKALADYSIQSPKVLEAYELSGRCGVLLKLAVETVAELSDFMEKVLDISGADHLEHCVVLNQLKDESKAIKIEV